jgi:PST family polysaccharide transporter
MLTLPIGALLIVLAQPIILLLFGDQWHDSVVVMQVLTAQLLATTLSIPCGTVYKVTGRAHILLWLTIPGLVFLVALLAIFTSHGIVAVAICGAALQGVGLFLTALIATRQLQLPLMRNARAVAPSFCAAIAMTVVMLPIEQAIETPIVVVIAAGLAGMVVYMGALFTLASGDLRRLRRMAFPQAAAR